MKVEPLSNLKQRTAQWNTERRGWLRKNMPCTLFVSLFCANGMTSLVSALGAGVTPACFLLGSLMGLCLAVPPLMSSYPKKPTQQDVELDVRLRKALNMDAKIEE